MDKIESTIQNNIISLLKNASCLRYGELKPKEIPNDLFNYHLQFLVKKKYINKTDKGYSLSKKGIKHIADSTINNTFKINPLLIVARRENGKLQILNQLRKSHPSFGKIGVPGGIVFKGESIIDASSRKLKIETGLDAKFKIIGMMRRLMYIENELFSDVIFPIVYTDKYSGTLLQNSDYGENMWVSIDEAIKNESAKFDSIISLPKVLRAVKKGTINKMPFFYEEDTQIKN